MSCADRVTCGAGTPGLEAFLTPRVCSFCLSEKQGLISPFLKEIFAECRVLIRLLTTLQVSLHCLRACTVSYENNSLIPTSDPRIHHVSFLCLPFKLVS